MHDGNTLCSLLWYLIAALLKSNHFTAQGLQRTLAAASLAKENVKYNANYVRKSPRALMAKGEFGKLCLFNQRF